VTRRALLCLGRTALAAAALVAALPGHAQGAPADYPPEALRHRWQRTALFTVAIDPQGRVAGCTITRSSGHPVLDDATCALVARRARFAPSKDADGAPVAGTYSSQIAWRLPR
jgi:protein TonB